MKIFSIVLVGAMALALCACSSTRRADGTTVSETVEITVRTDPPGARCVLTRGTETIATVAATPETVTIKRGIRSINVACDREGYIPGAETMQASYVGGQGTNPQQFDYSVAGSIGYGFAKALAAGVRAGSPANYEYSSFVNVSVAANSFPDAASRDAKYDELHKAIEERSKKTITEVQTNCGDNIDLCRSQKRDAEKARDAEYARLDGFKQQAVIVPPAPPAKAAKTAKPVAAKTN